MAVNYGLLEPVNIAGQFMVGRQQAQQNQLAQQQAEMRQQEFGMRKQEFATQAEDRKLKLDRANERNVFLTQLSDQMKQGGYTLNRETLGSMMNFGLKSNEESLVNLATKGLQALDEQDQFKTEMGRIAPKPNAPMGALGSGTFGMVPEPTNALAAAPVAAPSTNAMAGGYTRSQVEQMLTSPNARIRDMGKNLLGALPKEVAPPALTPLAKLQNELAALPPGDSRRAEYIAAIRKETQFAPTASTTVNMPVQEKAEQGERGKMLVTEYSDISKAAKLAAKTLPALEIQQSVLDSGFKTGFGTEAQKAGASLLAALGVPEANKFATDAQTFLAATQQAVLQRQLEQKGPQTESDAQRITQTGAQFGNTPESNKFIIAVAKSQLKRDIEQRNFYDGWWNKNKTYDGAENAWFNGEGGKSLFDRPELKKYKEPTAAPVAAPVAAPQGTSGFKYLGTVGKK